MFDGPYEFSKIDYPLRIPICLHLLCVFNYMKMRLGASIYKEEMEFVIIYRGVVWSQFDLGGCPIMSSPCKEFCTYFECNSQRPILIGPHPLGKFL